MTTLFWILISFLAGALPFSVWVGRLALKTDIRRFGDRNPGATNVTRAGGWQWGLLALSLDMLKGAIPIALAWYWAGLAGWPLVLVALAPILGHAYSPWLGFKGGKGIAVTGGVWGGLTMGEAPLLMAGLLVIWFLILANDGWVVLLTLLSFLLYLLAADASTILLAVWGGSILLLAWKHRTDLSHRPALRPWLTRRVGQ